LVVDLLLELAAEAAPPPTTAHPMAGLRTELERVAEASNGLPGRLLVALLAEAQHDRAVREALARRLFDPRRRATARVIRAAQRSGALRVGVPPLVAVDLLFGPLFYRRFIRQEPVTRGFVRRAFRYALEGLAPTRSAKSRPPAIARGRESPTGRSRLRRRQRHPPAR
jgi:hypothetical protein